MGDKNLVSSNFLIDGYARNGEFAMKLFDEMPNRHEFNWTSFLDEVSPKLPLIDYYIDETTITSLFRSQ